LKKEIDGLPIIYKSLFLIKGPLLDKSCKKG